MLFQSIASRVFLLASLAFLFPSLLSSQVPVVPGAEGWGIETAAGRGGTILRVTNLNESGTGSLASALSQNGPRTIIFEISGTIVLDDWLVIEDPFVTVAGQTAPSPGITIRGAGFRIRTHDVLIQHLRVRVGDGRGPSGEQRDGLEILSNDQNCYNIVVDHCSFSWAIDENLSIYSPNANYTNHDITVRYCIISEGLLNSIHPEGTHSMGLLVGGENGGRQDNISIISNLFAHNNQRNPMSQSRELASVNNLAYNWGEYAVTLISEGVSNKTSGIGNVFLAGDDSPSRTAPYTLSRYLANGSQIYLSDNLAPGYDDIYDNWAGFNPIVNFPPVWPDDLVALPSSQVEADVLENAGARPGDRDAVDTRIINDVENGTGNMINSQTAVGGWPVLAVNTRTLTTPSNPHGDDDGDGYTNLEEWLHTYSEDVGGSGGGGGGGGGGGSTVTLLTETFEGGNIPGSKWSHGDNNGTTGQDYWDDQSTSNGARVHAGSNSLYCADIGGYPGQMYDNNMDAFFELEQGLDISAYETVTVNFWTWYKMRPSGEYFSFDYLSGGEWVELDRWTGSDEQWEERTVTIPSDAGSTLYFRWFFHSDGSGRREGVYIDDVTVEGVTTEGARKSGGDGESLAQEGDLSLKDDVIPGEFRLEQNYPNPFNPSTNISFSVAEDAYTTLTVYDLLGREVARLVDGWMVAGNYSATFSGNNLANGMYIYRLESGSRRDTKRMMLLK